MSEEIFNQLYSDIIGKDISWDARNKMSDEETKHLIYGEIYYNTIINIYQEEYVKSYIDKAKSFCDLGSGTGRVVVETSMLLDNLDICDGIELLPELYNTANEVLDKYKILSPIQANKINYINNDFFKVDLSKYDIIFMHYPMKQAEELYLQLEEKMKKELKSGSLIISMIRKLRDVDNFPNLGSKKFDTDYGGATTYYHIKK